MSQYNKISAQELLRRIQSGSRITRSISNNSLYKNALIYFDEDSSDQFIPLDELILYIEEERIAINEILRNKQQFTDMVADLKLRPKRKRDPIMGDIVGQEFRKGLNELESSGLLATTGSGKRKSKKKRNKISKRKRRKLPKKKKLETKKKIDFKKLRKHITQRLKPRFKFKTSKTSKRINK